MFIRDSSGNPNQISKVFVRDAAGTPQEIAKIYVRDASGNPILVFDNTVTTFSCAGCDTGYTYYFTIGTSSPNSAYPFYTSAQTVSGSGGSCNSLPATQVTAGNTGYTPVAQIDKNYWSNIGVEYTALTHLRPTEEKTYYYTTEQTLECDTSDPNCLCNWLNNRLRLSDQVGDPPQQTPNELYPKLLQAFSSSFPNNPPIPGYIITDYKTFGKKSTVWALANMPQINWTNHGTEVDVDSYFSVCGAGNVKADGIYSSPITKRNTNIYPMYDRTVWLSKKTRVNPQTYNLTWFCNELTARCGQEYCLALYGDFYISWAMSTCWNNGAGGWQMFLYNQDADSPWSTFSCVPNGDGNQGNDSSGWEDSSGSVSLGTQTFCVSGPWPEWCITYECRAFFGGRGWDITEWDNINPFSWIVAKEKTNTSLVYPLPSPSADADDCCVDCLYGPTVSSIEGELDTCRNIYQIPPINSLDPPTQKFSFLSEWSSDQDNVAIGIASGVAFNTNNDPSPNTSIVNMRFVLPAYVTLSNNLIGKIIKIKQDEATLNAFINSGPYGFETDGFGQPFFDLPTYSGQNGSLNEDDFSVWKAISSFLGFNIKDAIDGIEEILPQKHRTLISSTSFYYEENRFDGNARLSASGNPIIPPAGITSATTAADPGQYPLLWWGFKGFPTEKHTHYVVLELDFSGSTTCRSFLTGSLRQVQMQPHNLKKMIKGMYFYPVHSICKELQGVSASTGSQSEQVTYAFRHPVFENYLVSSQLQNAPDVITNTSLNSEGGNGFIDYYANNLNTLTADQGGTGGQWNPTSINQTSRQVLPLSFNYAIKLTTAPTSPKIMYTSCLSLPKIGTYSDFLTKYYAAGTVI